MKRLLILTVIAMLAASSLGCQRNWLRSFYRGAPCSTTSTVPCETTPVYEGEYIPATSPVPVLPAPGPAPG